MSAIESLIVKYAWFIDLIVWVVTISIVIGIAVLVFNAVCFFMIAFRQAKQHKAKSPPRISGLSDEQRKRLREMFSKERREQNDIS